MSRKYIVTWDMLQIYARRLAYRLLPVTRWKSIIAVSRGGLIPSALLARELNIRFVDTICVSSYDHNRLRDLKILKHASVHGKNNSDIIIVDDLVDTGGTVQTIRHIYPKAIFVTIFAKPMGKSLVDEYIVDIPQKVWIEQPWDMGISYQKPLIKDF
ncbi:xanthine phosphoribosyltransferase [Buchnera aphidicola (Schlechtendalia chinensis)]|uniref:Xanthine-guanine phosphoribosyltransferase n=1 Tax=Buchnera aphidicola subsp. Schlechtendalia chinensis TaxID=118110 RepID=A0A172WDI2_BUCSC|nr:xanthine phosphoribosyltransferase [Buchnera aphidicola]ANF17021.1 xanthine phosphoribosyltransferase [Buchnera aphidicola (Schlechtendalia chinensis)]